MSLTLPIPSREHPQMLMAKPEERTSAIKAYSAVVLSSAAEIQSLRPVVKRSLQQNNPLLDPTFFLGSVSKGWVPRVVAVRQGSELKGVVYAKERTVCGLRLGIVYADLTFGCILLGDSLEQQDTFLIALEALLASTATRGIRLGVRKGSPELSAVRKLLASNRLDVGFSRVRHHVRLFLPDTYEQLLMSFGYQTRQHIRKRRRRFERAGHVYVENLSPDELRLAAFHLKPKCSMPMAPHRIDKFLKMAATADRPLAVGLKHRNGEWLSIACGVYTPAAGMVLMQLNNTQEFPTDSLSVVLKGYLLESLIHQGMKELMFWGGTGPPLSRYITHIPTLGIYLNSPGYAWRLVRGVVAKFGPWLPWKLARDARWIAPFSQKPRENRLPKIA